MVVIPYIALCGFIFLWLTIGVIKQRRAQKIAIGEHGDEHLRRAIRAHGNFVESAPIALLLLFAAESLELPDVLLHIAGMAFIAARISHALGLRFVEPKHGDFKPRIFGMMTTMAVIGLLALYCIAAWLFSIIQ